MAQKPPPVFLPPPPKNPGNLGTLKKWLYLVYLSTFNSAGIVVPLPISEGGTGADNLADAQSNLGIIPLPIAGDSNLVLQTNGSHDPVWSTHKLSMNGDITFAGDFTTSGSFPVTFTFTATTGVTFPTSGTLATTASLGSYLPLAGGNLVGDVTNTFRYLFQPTTFTTTMSQTGIMATIVGMNSSLASAYVIPATGLPFTVLTYQGTTTVPTNFSQTITPGTACTLYYFPNGNPLDAVSGVVSQTFLFNSIRYLSLGTTQSYRSFYNLSASNSFTTSTILLAPNNSSNQTASQSGTTVTGTGTSWDSSYIGHMLRYATGEIAWITAVSSTTSMTVTPSQTVAITDFDIPGKTNANEATSMDPRGNLGTNNLYINGSLIMPDRSTFITSGNHSTTLTTTGSTNVTLPTSGTLATTSQLPTGAALTKTDDTNVTLTLGGSPTTALLNAASLTLGWTGQLGLTRGGTNANLTANNGGIFYSTASAGAILAGTATAGKVLQSGATAAPSWSTPTYPSASGSTGKILRSDGTNNVYTTSTFSDTYTASNLLYSNGSNTVTGLATANNGVLITDGSGVPSISSTLPSAVQNNITAVNSGANTLSIGGSTKTFVTGAVNIPASSTDPTTYTPALTFGGGNTGITYASRSGYYRVITFTNGVQEVQFWGSIGLSNKGSSTGAAQFTIPVAAGANGSTFIITITPSGITTASPLIFGQIVTSQALCNIDTTGSAASYAQVTNSGFTNTSGFNFSGSYLVI